MIAHKTEFEGLFILEPKVFKDNRGHFFESFNQKKLTDLVGREYQFVQDNQSRSTYGVVRGLHFQTGAYEQAKLVRVLRGEVLDVVVDLRGDSPMYGRTFSIKLSEENALQLLIPRGFAHGLAVLSEEVDFFYKCDNFYSPEHEGGLHYSSLGIDWMIPEEKMIVSDKDKVLPIFESNTIR
ncbi:dTDP-4-dehydrorhamnose 3,5-epimerase [Cytophagales bacterium LB-30]|uniref:dTDP-4-dehydrorhamnose 3,5-epimerase n=1 Tax=Shiella aurantiaca TaxID=3058365 RepID=A0ABT8F323_9BACT|nr:dTDP-4-dehydrorhamnose 3,5-epimerase [Shiella aurantiaca]MDN4164621.1 dTDP-4-dehydrorhamnose 3,5-epimerase [Shiella aurantiaca]